jgi:hypothetical protein
LDATREAVLSDCVGVCAWITGNDSRQRKRMRVFINGYDLAVDLGGTGEAVTA